MPLYPLLPPSLFSCHYITSSIKVLPFCRSNSSEMSATDLTAIRLPLDSVCRQPTARLCWHLVPVERQLAPSPSPLPSHVKVSHSAGHTARNECPAQRLTARTPSMTDCLSVCHSPPPSLSLSRLFVAVVFVVQVLHLISICVLRAAFKIYRQIL